MTLTTTSSRVSYPGTGTTGPFAFPYRILSSADLLLTKRSSSGVETTLTLTTHYTVAGVLEATGSVTLVTALAIGETLIIRRRPALTQPESIRNQGEYFPATIEDEFDRLTMQLQSLQDQLDRTPKLKESVDPSLWSMAGIEPVANQVLAFNAAGTGIEARSVSDGATTLPGSGRTVLTLTQYLVNNAVYNVLDYGAVGDGVAADKAAFKLTVANCPAGGVMRAPRTSSFYKIDISLGESDAILIDKKMTVVLEGIVKSTVGAIQANPPTIFRITAKNVTFTGDGSYGGDGTVNSVNTGTDATLPSLIKVEADSFTMTGLTIDTPYKIGIFLSGCYYAKILNCKFTGGPTTYTDTAYFAIRGYQGGNHVIAENQFYPDAAGGMYVNCIFFNGTHNSLIEGNVATRPYEKLAYIAGSHNVISGNNVIGRSPAEGVIPGTNVGGTMGPVYRVDGTYNKIIGNRSQYGGGAQSLGGVGTDISDNTFLDCGQSAISILETAAVAAFDYINICNNVGTCGNMAGTAVGDGILIRTPNGFGPSRYIRIAGNTIVGFSKTNPLANIVVWVAATAYTKQMVVQPTVANGFYYAPQVAGVSAGVQPVWPVVAGNTVVDGTITWVCLQPDTALYAQIRLVAPAAGQEANRCMIVDNNVAGGLRGIRTDRMDNSEVMNNRIHATDWGIVEGNGSSNRYGFNPIEGAANLGIQTLAATSVAFNYSQGSWVPQIEDAALNQAVMAGVGANNGFWTRIGRLVTVTGNVVSTGPGPVPAGAAIRIKNLPFAGAGGAGASAGAVFGAFVGAVLPAAGQSIAVSTVNGQKYVTLNKWSAVGGTTVLTMAEFGVGGGPFSLTYFTDDP